MSEEKKMSKCVIVSAGDLYNSSIPIMDGDLIIACDAGFMYCNILSIEPHVVIGDFDSISEEDFKTLVESFPEMISFEEAMERPLDLKERLLVKLPVEKDYTDTFEAILYGLSKGYREFHLYAATGGCLDHTMANIQILLYLKQNGAKGYIWDDGGMYTVIQNESISFKKDMEGRISVFAMNGDAKGVSIEGLYYEIENATLSESFPLGVSNSFNGKESTITVNEGALLIIMYWDE